MKWITRERPKIDRISYPWLFKRFIDSDAEILFAPKEKVLELSEELGAFDIQGVEYTHFNEFCTFDYFLKKHNLSDQALIQLADIIRGADTGRLGLTPQCAGLWAISAGLAYNFDNDWEMLEIGMKIYDALYYWAKYVRDEKHSWGKV